MNLASLNVERPDLPLDESKIMLVNKEIALPMKSTKMVLDKYFWFHNKYIPESQK